MASIYKFLNQELTLSSNTANLTISTVYSSPLVRVVNPVNQAHKITQKWANGATKATFTLINDTDIVIIKLVDDTLQVDTGADVLVTPVAFTN